MQERGCGMRSACNVGDVGSADNRKARLLIVEDETLIATYLSELLGFLGCDVCARATSGLAALKAAERDRPDLAIVDIGLPGGMDGVNTAYLLRRQFDIPSIFLSGASNTALLARARMVQAPAFIEKPFTLDDVERAIKAALPRRPDGRLESGIPGGAAKGSADPKR